MQTGAVARPRSASFADAFLYSEGATAMWSNAICSPNSS